MEMKMATFRRTHDFKTAFAALSAIYADPDDTKQAFTIVQALGGPSAERQFKRFRKTVVGKKALETRRSLLSALTDVARLEALPEHALGRAYLEFLRSQAITADGLVEAMASGTRADGIGEDRMMWSDRMRDMHDLWHVVAGYRGDMIGEAAVLALTYAQVKNPGAAFIALLGFAKIGAHVPGARRTIAKAFARGVRATWLPSVDWEEMLARPLDEVRAAVGLTNPPSYEPLYKSDPRAQEILAGHGRPQTAA